MKPPAWTISVFKSILAVIASGLLLHLGPAMAAAPGPAATGLSSIPTGKGLPVTVRTALFFNHIESFDENKSTFEATTDLRMSWTDLRLKYPAEEGLNGYKEYRISAAEVELAKIWSPRIRYINRVGEPSLTERRLRIFPDGRVETITRTTAVYKTPVNVSRFPFDHQSLDIEIAVHEDTVETVDLNFTHEDVNFSRVAKSVEIDGWNAHLVNLRRDLIKGWNGDRYAKLIVSLDVERMAGSTVPTIFVPLFASLLIPFLAVWMNKAEDGGFAVDAFELANVVIGGIFAVIALSFTISSAFPVIAASDNTVTRLIGLNYVALAVGLLITVSLYRYRLPARWFGPYVQEQVFHFLTWAFPVSFIATGLAFVMASAV